jgi:hypothetical protein
MGEGHDLSKQAEDAMDGEISISRKLQTDGIVAAAAKRERGSGNPRRFEAQLSKERESSEDPDHEAEADEPPEVKDAEVQPDPPAPAAPAVPAEDDGLLDFEA